MRRKLAGRTYSNNFEFGFRDGSVAAPSGIINTQNIEQTIRHLVARSLGTSDFDRLPIPFRAIATDMMTGEMVVLVAGRPGPGDAREHGRARRVLAGHDRRAHARRRQPDAQRRRSTSRARPAPTS